MPSGEFFLLSRRSHLSFFHLYVVASPALGVSSNSGKEIALRYLMHRFLYALTICFWLHTPSKPNYNQKFPVQK